MQTQFMTLVLLLAPALTNAGETVSAYSSLSFSEYAADNARNPALARQIADYQTAFVDISKIAVISMPPQFQEGETKDAGVAPVGNRQPASLSTPTENSNAPTAPSAAGNSGPLR